MRSNAKKTFYFHADAHSLGGFIEKPFQKTIPSQASVSLPAVGGFATTRSEAFNFEEIISCRSAYTRVSARLVDKDGPGSVQVTSVLEGLNILEVVTAERLVAQISFETQTNGEYPRISFTGSRFEGLQIGGCDVSLALNPSLLECGRGAGIPRESIAWPLFQKTGEQQAAKLIESVEADDDRGAFAWLIERYGWMAQDREPGKDGFALCSLVDGVDCEDGVGQAIPGRSFGHVLEIPDFGRIFLAEVTAYPASLQLSMIRAELGCNVSGGGSASSARLGVHTLPP
jgi:hypothetical protein